MPHNPTPNSHQAARWLSLTEPASAPGVGAVTEADIRELVDSFYRVVRDDAVLGPIFDRHIKDWSLHLPRMYDFWSTVVLRTGRYAGRPIEAHAMIPDLTLAHFERWLSLWEATVTRVLAVYTPPAREAFIASAQRMAASMAGRLCPA